MPRQSPALGFHYYYIPFPAIAQIIPDNSLGAESRGQFPILSTTYPRIESLAAQFAALTSFTVSANSTSRAGAEPILKSQRNC